MDPLMIVLRVVHIGAGVVWVGGALFLVLVLAPRLKRLGPAVQGPVMAAIVPVFVPMFSYAALLVIGSGIWIALKLRWGVLDRFFADEWGYAILAAFVLTVAGLGLAMTVSRSAMNAAMALGASMQGRPPTPEEGMQMGAIQGRITWSTRATTGLLVLAVIAMASARWL